MSNITTIPTLCWSVASNPSPLGVKLHDAGYNAKGLDYKYVALGSDDIAPVIAAVRTLQVRGLGVSMPHKITVLAHLDEVTKDVDAIGACNTVVNDGGRLVGHNTDWRGAQLAIEEAGLAQCKTALLIGGGGVARAIAYALKQQGTAVTVATRRVEQAEQLAADLDLAAAVPLDGHTPSTAELVVNATPDASSAGGAVELSRFESPLGVFDVVFQTRTTALTAAAHGRDIAVVPGWRMLLWQAIAQFELYTEQQAPVDAMAAVLEQALPPN